MTKLREDILAKYGVGKAKTSKSNISADGKALEPNPTSPANPTGVKQAEETSVSLRDSILSKYTTKNVDPKTKKVSYTSINEPTPTEVPTISKDVKPKPVIDPKTGRDLSGVIASPEYFANKLDVFNEKGRFVETIEGPDAYERAKEKALEIGGNLSVHTKGGFLGRAAKKVKEAVVGAFDNVADKGADFISSLGNYEGDARKPVGVNEDNIPVDRYGTPTQNYSGSQKLGKFLEAGTGTVGAVLSPVSGLFAGAEEVPVLKYPAMGVNYIFGKLGEGGGWVGKKVVENLPISEQAKKDIEPGVEELSALLAQIAAGKAGSKGTKLLKEKTATIRNDIKVKLTKDVLETNNLPQTVYIEPAKIRDIFQTGKKISEAELDLVKSLGLDGTKYKEAIANGLTIDIPAERIITITDKPYWAKVKGVFGVDSTPEVFRAGDKVPTAITKGLLPEPSGKPVNAPRIVENAETTPTSSLPKTAEFKVSGPVKTALESPINSKLIETIKAFTPEEGAAFGRRIIERINEEVGTKITEGAAKESGIPENIKINEIGSPDGRPAQFTNGKIEIFLPDLKRDLQALAQGKRIMAHGGANAKVYELKAGESMEELAIRYTKDVLVHELSHQKTVNIEDNTQAQILRQDILKAKASKDQKAIIQAETAMQKFMETLETKALAYERSNREGLEAELFGKGGRKSTLQSKIDESISPKSKTVTRTEKDLLKSKFKRDEKTSKVAFKSGEKAGSEATGSVLKEKLEQTKEGLKKEKDLALLKQRIIDRSKSENTIGEIKSGFQKTLEKINDKQATISEKRQILIDYAEAFLPFRERGKFLKAIRSPGSDKKFGETLARMQKAADTVNRKALMSEIRAELKDTKVKFKDKKPNAKFEYEAQKKLNTIRALQAGFEQQAKNLRASGVKNANAYELAQNEIANKIADWQTSNPDSLIPEEILNEIQNLKMVGIGDMTASELRSVLADIQSIKETGRTLKDIERFNRETEVTRVKDGVIDTITGGRKNPKETQGLRRSEDKLGTFEKIGDFFTLKHAGFEEILDALSRFDKKSKPYESFISEHFSKKVRDSFVAQNTGEIAQIKKISEVIMENYGFKSNKEMAKYLNSMKEKVTLDNVVMEDGTVKQIVITKGEAMKMYEWAQDETLAKTFTEGLNWGEEAQARVFDLLSDADKKMAQKNLDFYREYYKGINDAYVKEYGVDLPFNENYSPLSRDVETSIPENVLLAQEMKAYATAKNNSLKARVKNNIELKPKDAFSVMVNHINQMEHYKAWSESMYEMRRVFGDKQVRRTMEDYHGRKYIKEVDSFLNDFARDGIDKAKTVEWLDQLRVNTTTALLGLNWKQFPKQLTGVTNYWIEMPTDAFFSGVGGFWKSPLEKSKFLYEKSAVLRERFGEGYERDIKRALQTNEVKTLASTKNSIREKMFVFLRQADKLTVYQGGWAAYRYKYMELKKAGKTNAEAEAGAIKYAEDVTNRVQESSQLDTLSSIQRGGSLYKALTMFGGQPSKYVRLMWNIARNWKYGRGSKATHIKRFLVLWLVVPTIYNLVSEQLKKEENRATPGELAGKIALGPLTYPLIVGQIFTALYDRVSGSRFNFNISPTLSIFDDAMSGIDQLTAGDIDEALTYFLDVVGKTSGVPTPIITRPLRDSLKEDDSGKAGASASF